MSRPAEPKTYPLISDSLFGGRVKIEEKKSKVVTKAAAKKATAKKVGNAKLLKDADGVLSTNQTKTAITKGGASMGGYKSQKGNTENPDNEEVGGQMTDAFKPLAEPRGTAKAVRRDTASAEARPNKPLPPKKAANVAGNKKASVDTRMSAAEQM